MEVESNFGKTFGAESVCEMFPSLYALAKSKLKWWLMFGIPLMGLEHGTQGSCDLLMIGILMLFKHH